MYYVPMHEIAHVWPNAHVDAVDISSDALAVARRNVADYKMEEIVYELNKVACELAVEAAKEVSGRVRCGEPQLVDEASRAH